MKTISKFLLAMLVIIGMSGCGSTGATGAAGADGVDGQDGEDLEINIVVNQPEPEPSTYFNLETGIVAIDADLDETGSGEVTISYSVIDNAGDNFFVFTQTVDGELVKYEYPDEVKNLKSKRVDFVSSFTVFTNLSSEPVEYRFEITYDTFDAEDNYIKQVLIAGTLVVEPFQAGLTEEEIIELVRLTIEENIEDITITIEAPECVVCENNETETPVEE